MAVLALAVAGCGAPTSEKPAAQAPATAVAVAVAVTAVPSPAVRPATSPAPTATPTQAPSPVPSATTAPPTATATATAQPPTPSPAPATATASPSAEATGSIDLRRDVGLDLANGQLDGVEATGGDGLSLVKDQAGHRGEGSVLSSVHDAPGRFNDLILSWNGSAPAGTSLTFSVRVRAVGEWSRWYAIGGWRDGVGATARDHGDDWGEVDVDTVVLRRPADGWQYRVTLATNDTALTPVLMSVSVVAADRSGAPTGPKVDLPAGWARDLPVPVESQAIQDPAVAWQICSPTSLYMVMRYWGLETTLPEVYGGVRNRASGVAWSFGVWPLNTAFAGERGFDAYVTRLYSMDQVRAEVARGRPVPVSIRYNAGELPGAPLDSTGGHFIVVRGFTEDGGVIVNDPAAPGRASVRRVLQADDLERLWLRSGGVAYMLGPRD